MIARLLPVIACAAVWLCPTAAQACKCAVIPRDAVIASMPVVFDGEVLRAEVDEAGTRVVTTFRIHGAIKGVVQRSRREQLRRRSEQTITILSRLSDAECGWDFRKGPQRLTIGAERTGADLIVTRCIIYNLNSTFIRRP